MVVIKVVSTYPSDNFALWARLLICPSMEGQNYGSGGIPAQIVTASRGIVEAGN